MPKRSRKKAEPLQVTRDQLVTLFKDELGVAKAGSWGKPRMEEKVASIADFVDEDTECEEEENQVLLDALLVAAEKGQEVVILAEAPDDDEEPAEEDEEPTEEDEEPTEEDASDEVKDEEDEETVPVKPTKKGARVTKTPGGKGKTTIPASKANAKKSPQKAKTKKEPKGPGVIASIVEFLQKASKTKPLTKKALCDRLAERFPDRAPESMMRTINVQVPNRLKVDKGLEVQKNDKGYWLAK